MSVLHKFTEEEVQRLTDLWAVDGITMSEISSMMKKGPKTLDLAARELGLRRKLPVGNFAPSSASDRHKLPARRMPSASQISHIQNLLDGGVSPFEIEMRMEIPQETIKYLISRNVLHPNVTTGQVMADGWYTFGELTTVRRATAKNLKGQSFIKRIKIGNQDKFIAEFIPTYHSEEEKERFLTRCKQFTNQQVAIRLIKNNDAYLKRVVDISIDPDILETAQPYVPEENMSPEALKANAKYQANEAGIWEERRARAAQLSRISKGATYRWTTLKNWKLVETKSAGEIIVLDTETDTQFFISMADENNNVSQTYSEVKLYAGEDVYLCFDMDKNIVGIHPMDLGAGEFFNITDTHLQTLAKLRKDFSEQQQEDEKLRAGLRLDIKRSNEEYERLKEAVEKEYKERNESLETALNEAEKNSYSLHSNFRKALRLTQGKVDKSQAMAKALEQYLQINMAETDAKLDAEIATMSVDELEQRRDELKDILQKRKEHDADKKAMLDLQKTNPALFNELMEYRKAKKTQSSQELQEERIIEAAKQLLGPVHQAMQEQNRMMAEMSAASAISAEDAQRYSDMLAEDANESAEEIAKNRQAVDDIADEALELITKSPFGIRVSQGHPRNMVALRAGVNMHENPNPDLLRIKLTRHLKGNSFMATLVDYNDTKCQIRLVKDKNGDVVLKSYMHTNFAWKEIEDKHIGLGGKQIKGIKMAQLLKWHEEITAKLPASKKKGQRN